MEDKFLNHTLGDDGTSLVFRANYIGTDETFTYEVRAVNAGGPGAALASNAIDLPPATRFRWELPEVRVPGGRGHGDGQRGDGDSRRLGTLRRGLEGHRQ